MRRNVGDRDFPRIDRPLFDPALEIRDYGRRQLALRRHLKILVAQSLHHEALLRLTGHDSGTALAPFASCLAAVEEQPPLKFFRLPRMALVAMRDQDGADFCLEEFDLIAWQLDAWQFLAAGDRGQP